MEKVYALINRLYQGLLPVFVIALAVQCTLTTMDNRKLKSEITTKWQSSPRSSIQMAPLDLLKTGDKLEPISVQDLSGKDYTIAQTGTTKKTLLLAFTTTCPACKANAPNWVNLYSKIDKTKWDVIGISLDDPEKTKAYVAEKGFEFPVAAMKDKKEILKPLKIRKIPTTIVIDENQTAQGVWIGSLEKQLSEVEKVLELVKS